MTVRCLCVSSSIYSASSPVLKLPLLALALLTATVAAQPLADDPPDPSASEVLDASLDAVVHDGGLVLLWDALPSAYAYTVQTAAPGEAFADAYVLDANTELDAAGYSVRLDLPDGAYRVRLLALGTRAVTAPRDLTVEAADAFWEAAPALADLIASRD